MTRSLVYTAAAVTGLVVAGSVTVRSAQSRPPLASVAAQQQSTATKWSSPNEQAWIVANVTAAVTGMARFGAPSGSTAAPVLKGEIKGHIWTPATYAPLAASIMGAAKPSNAAADLHVRDALATLTVDALLDQNDRLSALLARDMRSASAQESAALLVGAHALRETWSIVYDVRPALARMAAHLAMAQVLRGEAPASVDGALAGVLLTTFAGLQRDALTALDALEPRLTSASDRAWSRALRLRVTGDWRTAPKQDAPLVERLEHARALRNRVGSEALLDYFDTFEQEPINDWHRLALTDYFNVETGHRFTGEIVEREMAEAHKVWTRLNGTPAAPEALLAALNTRPARGPVRRNGQQDVVQVLDWGTWASFEQRQLVHALTALTRHYWNLGWPEKRQALVAIVKDRYAGLTLYPVALRWIASSQPDYELSVRLARDLVAVTPELVPVAAWNLLGEKPDYVVKAQPFMFMESWFAPVVPAGTAYDLPARALLPGCPRPPTPEQARIWAQAAPYEHWTVWSAEYLTKGKPSLETMRKAFGPLMQYDFAAPSKIVQYLDMSASDRIAVSRQLCDISVSSCDVLAEQLLRDGREAEAVTAYEHWVRDARNSVRMSNELTWLVRHYSATGNTTRAEELATRAAASHSYRGLETLGLLLDSQGRYEEAEEIFKAMAERYDDTRALGTFTIRKARRTSDRELELKGWSLLQEDFPVGVPRLALHALDAQPKDGMAFATFGRRPEKLGLRATDIVVGVDEWRVRTAQQYQAISRLGHDEQMTFTVWRGGKYQQIRARVPERWLGVELKDYRGGSAGN